MVSKDCKPTWICEPAEEHTKSCLLCWMVVCCPADLIQVEEEHKLLYLCPFKAEEMTYLCIIPSAQRESASPVSVYRSILMTSKLSRPSLTAHSSKCCCCCSKSCCCCYVSKTTSSHYSLPCKILAALPPLSNPQKNLPSPPYVPSTCARASDRVFECRSEGGGW
jgi:hypothetical protein